MYSDFRGRDTSRIHGSIDAAGVRGQLGQLALGHALLLRWLARLIPTAWMGDCMLTLLFFSSALVLFYDIWLLGSSSGSAGAHCRMTRHGALDGARSLALRTASRTVVAPVHEDQIIEQPEHHVMLP